MLLVSRKRDRLAGLLRQGSRRRKQQRGKDAWVGERPAVIDFGTCGVGDPACDLGDRLDVHGSRTRAFSAVPHASTTTRGRERADGRFGRH